MDYTKQARILMLIGVAFGFAGLAVGNMSLPTILSLKATVREWLTPEPPVLVPAPAVVVDPVPQTTPAAALTPAEPKVRASAQTMETVETETGGAIPGLPRMPVQNRHIRTDAGGGAIVNAPPRRYPPLQPPSGSGKAVDDFLN